MFAAPVSVRIVAATIALVVFRPSPLTATDWPLNIANHEPSESNSEIKAELPPGINVTPAARSVPPRRAAFLGIWHGWMCNRKAVDVKIAVTEITGDTAVVAYAVGRKAGQWRTRTIARFAGGELQFRLPNESPVALRRRPPKVMEVKWQSARDANRWCAGVLGPRDGDAVAALPKPEIVPPAIGRLRPQPGIEVRGPRSAAGLVVWSHGYAHGLDAARTAPHHSVAAFVKGGYDLYRFDRRWINNWASDAGDLSDAVGEARRLGYKRVLLMGQSAGAWVSIASLGRDVLADGVLAVAPAHHGQVGKMYDPTIAGSDWETIIGDIRPGPRVAVVLFSGDAYDVGGRGAVAKKTLVPGRNPTLVLDRPDGFDGHGAGASFRFAQKFGRCLFRFLAGNGGVEAPCAE
jgi:hypothetical protein